MRWNLKKARVLTNTWKRVMMNMSLFFCTDSFEAPLPEECRDTWTPGRRRRASPKTPQQSCINQVVWGFFQVCIFFNSIFIFLQFELWFFTVLHLEIKNLWVISISLSVLGGCSLKKHSKSHRDIRSRGWKSVMQTLPSAHHLTNCTWRTDLSSAELYRLFITV